MITFGGKEIALDKPIYILFGAYAPYGRIEKDSWFPVKAHELSKWTDLKAFKCEINTVRFSDPGVIHGIKVYVKATDRNHWIYASDRPLFGKSVYEARTLFEEM